ncbi:Zinc carboxypeptidase [Pseudidiomarina planktonica]|uniref:Zinc carboxypeptidase n=1 Tax=Pseudidiomarina planktonica TaxID=1323738 RepID=A0A1Y6ERA9_9GAMM|nr:M14 metallopeptidase family protein [Pseudidiomarina planktonica]RUO65468.1 peptidase M14 [Pseudidiomarina planktonica]SMQ64866.1 Zinc carboxypeptidase [Pseudidiomarina planktonica]
MKPAKVFRAASLALCCSGLFGLAQASTADLGLDVTYDTATPTVEKVLGYDLASRISSPEAIVTYLTALAEAHPDRVKLLDYGTSWEGRPLVYLAISSADNMANFDEFQTQIQQLADPRVTNTSGAESIMQSLPASIWLSYGVHGNEISSPEAALLTAYHLLAATDEKTQGYLDNTVVFIDPLQNPDGRGRFVNRYYQNAGMVHSADRISVEHNEPWPNGRTNHYLFDMNRDWLALTQPEIKGQVAELLKYYPLAFVDLHEMSGDSSYYFTPEAEPYNPYITESQREGLNWIGKNNGAWFDREGFDYFTREIFDAFYPGYGASWPAYHGALSMTYEMASSRGHEFRTKDGDILTYGDGVYRHFIASVATVETVSNRREALLNNFWEYRKSAIDEGRQHDERYLIFNPEKDAAATQKLAALMTDHGIDVQRAEESFKTCGTDYPQGTFIVDKAQPAYRMIGTLLDQQIDMAPHFIAEQERRRGNNLPDQIYDVTAWSLPLMFNVAPDTCGRTPRVATVAADNQRIKPGQVINADAEVAFLVPWGDMNAGRFLTAALRHDLVVKSSDLPFTLENGSKYPAGSLILTRSDNGADLVNKITAIANESGATVTGVDSSWVVDGPNFGSENVVRMHAPNIAIAWDEPASVLSAGNTRFVIERQFNYPVTAIRPNQLARADLSHYQVLILPGSYRDYQQSFGESGTSNLKEWIADGGVLITLGRATRYAVEQNFINSKRELAASDKEDVNGHDDSVTKGQLFETAAELQHAVDPADVDPYWVSGVLANTNVDQEHWLSAGVKPEVVSLVVGNDIYTPLTIDNGRNIATFAGPDDVLASGFIWDETRTQIAFKPLVMWQPKGKGMVISYTQEPTYRAYLDGLNVLFMNSIFRAAAHATPLR